MAPTGLRERNKQKRRIAIRTAAMQLFAERGYDETTIADIAESIEIAPRTVTLYYPNKQDLVLGRFSESAERLSRLLQARRSASTIFDIFIDWLKAERREIDDVNLERVQRVYDRNPQLRALAAVRMASVRAELTQAIADEIGVDPADPIPLVTAAAVMGIYEFAWTLPQGAFDETMNVAMQFLRAGLERASPTPP